MGVVFVIESDFVKVVCLCVSFGCVVLLGCLVTGFLFGIFFIFFVFESGLTGFFFQFFFLLVGLVCGVVGFGVVCCVC